MTKSIKNPVIEAYFREAQKWQKELRKLRGILLGCGLTEEWKWEKPCYTLEGRNVVILLPLKNYCALLFCKGALLKNAEGLLVRPSENTQAARQMRFTDFRELVARETVVKATIEEAVAVEKAGLEVTYKKITEHAIPEELQAKLDQTPALKAAFQALTPGRQRGYLLHFSAPKQAKTRESRIEKCVPQILKGKGLNDRGGR